MQKIRHATQKHRTILLVVVAVIIVGLVVSFSVWGSNDYAADSGTSWDDLTYAQKVEQYEKIISENGTQDVSSADYSTAQSMGGLYMELYSLCQSAYTEAYSTEPVNKEAADGYSKRAGEALDSAAAFYQQAIDAAPADLADVALAQAYTNLGAALLYRGNIEEAGAAYEKAVSLAPENIFIRTSYADYLYYIQGYAAAETYINSCLEGLDENSNDYVTLTDQLAKYKAWEDFYNKMIQDSMEEKSEESSGSESETSGDSGADSSTNATDVE